MSLTDEGFQFLNYAKDLIRQYEATRSSVGRRSVVPMGLLRVTAPALFAKKLLPGAINAFLTDHPETKLDLILSDEILSYAAEGIDVAIRIGKLTDSTLVARKLGESHRVLCASPTYISRHGVPSRPSDLKTHNCIIFVGEDVWRLRNTQEDTRVKVSGRFNTNDAEMATRAALDGHGIALRSLWDISDDLQAGRLTRILPGYETPTDMAIYAIYPPGRFISVTAKRFVKLVSQHAASLGI